MVQIQNLDTLLLPVLGEQKITSYVAKNLIAAGENYGSVMLAVDLKLENDAKEENELHLVAKLCPPNEFIKEMFNIPVTFKKEVAFYAEIIPTLQDFQRECGCDKVMDFFPKYFGSRINLDGNSKSVDDDACLLLENIKSIGYDIGDRINGFNLETAQYIIKDLATFHAVPIALKIAKPNLFQQIIEANLINHLCYDGVMKEIHEEMTATILDVAGQNKECARYLDRIRTAIETSIPKYFNRKLTFDEPFGTIVHNDYWVNNTMLKFNENLHPIANAIVDFQLILYGNPAHDLIFFIYSSLNTDIITENYQNLIDLYYETFINVLKDLKVNTDRFTYELFLEQIKYAATEWEFYHILFMLKPICADKSKVKNLSDVNQNEMTSSDGVSENYYTKLWFTILDFVDKNWI